MSETETPNTSYKRLQADVQGIFRFILLIKQHTTLQELMQQAEDDFQQTYQLVSCPKFVKVQSDESELVLQDSPANMLDMQRISLIPDQTWVEGLKKSPWQILGIDENEFEVRIELMRKVYGEETNIGVLRSCLLRSGGNLGKAIAVCSYIRPDILGSQRKIVFVRPRQESK